jgi:hypothetical protein
VNELAGSEGGAGFCPPFVPAKESLRVSGRARGSELRRQAVRETTHICVSGPSILAGLRFRDMGAAGRSSR